MRRYYSREAYLELADHIRERVPYCTLSSDFIVGFCGETEEQFEDTATLMERIKFEMTFIFLYSMREKTHAYHKLDDDIPLEVKKQRLNKLVKIFKEGQLIRNNAEIGNYHLVLVDGVSKRKNDKLMGRTDTNKICIFDNKTIPSMNGHFSNLSDIYNNTSNTRQIKNGDYIIVKVDNCSNNSLFVTPVSIITNTKKFFELSKGNPCFKPEELNLNKF
jgi:tRNA A37 methylthiotransferase MiaB